MFWKKKPVRTLAEDVRSDLDVTEREILIQEAVAERALASAAMQKKRRERLAKWLDDHKDSTTKELHVKIV